MARIRTIKPEFWTDEKIVQIPFEARLLFVGLWNFADDDGLILDEPDRIRLEILPADQVDAGALIDLLVAAELIERLDLQDGRSALRIPTFARHQKISHKTPSRIPTKGAKKRAIPNAVRRAVAIKYGCKPGNTLEVECYHCGAPGSIWWASLTSGRPSAWVAFSGVELDHFIPENSGGTEDEKNIVLSCRYCNRSRRDSDSVDFILKSIPENSGALRTEGKGREGNRVTPSTSEPRGSSAEPPLKPTPEKPKPQRGTRLLDWAGRDNPEISAEWWNYCAKRRPGLDPAAVFQDFVDYWAGQPNPQGVKVDWTRTWQRWVRSEKGERYGTTRKPSAGTEEERIAERRADITEALGLDGGDDHRGGRGGPSAGTVRGEKHLAGHAPALGGPANRPEQDQGAGAYPDIPGDPGPGLPGGDGGGDRQAADLRGADEQGPGEPESDGEPVPGGAGGAAGRSAGGGGGHGDQGTSLQHDPDSGGDHVEGRGPADPPAAAVGVGPVGGRVSGLSVPVQEPIPPFLRRN